MAYPPRSPRYGADHYGNDPSWHAGGWSTAREGFRDGRYEPGRFSSSPDRQRAPSYDDYAESVFDGLPRGHAVTPRRGGAPVDYESYAAASGLPTTPRSRSPASNAMRSGTRTTPMHTGFTPIGGPMNAAHEEAMRKAGARPLAPAQRALLDDVIQLYNPKPNIGLVRNIWAPDGKFIDPLSEVKGHRDIENQFLLLERFFEAVEFRETAAYALELKSPPATVIVCENNQFYWRHGKKEPFAVRAVTTLELDKQGKVHCHRDQWLDKGEEALKQALHCRHKSFFYDVFARKPLTWVGSWYGERYRKSAESGHHHHHHHHHHHSRGHHGSHHGDHHDKHDKHQSHHGSHHGGHSHHGNHSHHGGHSNHGGHSHHGNHSLHGGHSQHGHANGGYANGGYANGGYANGGYANSYANGGYAATTPRPYY
eukprot:tig00000378_g24500.t1